MTTLLPISKPISHLHLAPGSKMTIPAVTWEEFETILAELGERRSARIAYCHNTLEITVPCPDHELPTDLIGDIVKTILRTTRQRYQPFGSTTFKQQGIAGIEPDACFYIQNYERMIGRRRLEPGDPPPDLAIETDVTSLTAIAAYQAIGVPEVWIYANGGLKIYLLQVGEYVPSVTSGIFPQLPIVEWVDRAVDRAWTVGSLQALEEVEDCLRSRDSQ
jgi:Uma2 family endonuclease